MSQYVKNSQGEWSERIIGEVKLTGSNMELYGLSTDQKPTANLVVGTSFFEIDTTEVYMWDGTQWRLI